VNSFQALGLNQGDVKIEAQMQGHAERNRALVRQILDLDFLNYWKEWSRSRR